MSEGNVRRDITYMYVMCYFMQKRNTPTTPTTTGANVCQLVISYYSVMQIWNISRSANMCIMVFVITFKLF